MSAQIHETNLLTKEGFTKYFLLISGIFSFNDQNLNFIN